MTEEYNAMVNSEEIIGSTEYLALYTRCHINRCRYNRVRLHFRPRIVKTALGRYALGEGLLY
jgi:hypothetical protein